ncbi:hypothetical protein LEN26_010172 [Aphanomyces euteiches]|nr:hypothetical protein LEN26_010172 [Aphanomyces euteiches]
MRRHSTDGLRRIFFSTEARARRASKLKQRTLVDVTIFSLDFHGNGVGHDTTSNALCTVVNAIPGQRWKGRVVNDRCDPVRVVGMELLQQSENYMTPSCPHFNDCGGCKTQHLPYKLQAQAKESAVHSLLQPYSSNNTSIDKAVTTLHYRNKTEFTVSAGRWLTKYDQEGLNRDQRPPFTIGFFPKSNGTSRKWDGRVVAIDKCLLQDSLANRILEALWSIWPSTLPAYNFLDHTGFVRNIVLRIGTSSSGAKQAMIGFSTSTLSETMAPIVPLLLEALKPSDASLVTSIVQFVDEEMQRREPSSQSTTVLHGEPYILDTILGCTFRISLRAFFQPNTAMATVLYAHLVDIVASHETPPVVWDLFCGVGSIGICLAKHARQVVGIELIPEAVVDAKYNAELNGVQDKTTFVCADVLADSGVATLAGMPRPDVVIVDPPRPGLSAPLISFLCDNIAPEEIIYVSCNPLTQARDLERMSQKYYFEWSKPVDMLPHTPHVENIVRLYRRK